MRVRRLIWAFFLLSLIPSLLAGATTDEEQGTSVTILVDFSASFSPLKVQDDRALKEIVRAIADLSVQWSPPIKITWPRIEKESLLARPLCEPIEFSQRLIKREGKISTREELQERLQKCEETVVRRSQKEISMKTDISGAVLAAAERARNMTGEKLLVIISDFDQDLPIGAKAADFQLYGERVVMIHRPWSNDANDPNRYFQRIHDWSEHFGNRGAKQVIQFPVFTLTEHRLARALGLAGTQPGTSVAILADLKARGTSDQNEKSEYGTSLYTIAAALTDLAKEWPPPVTFTWANIESSGTLCDYMLPLVLNLRLIKKIGEMNSPEDLRIPMEESAAGLTQRFYGRTTSTDISGAVALVAAGSDLGEKRILIVLSDFFDNGRSGVPGKFPLDGASVLMIWRFAQSDGVDASAWAKRVATWEQSFKDNGAISVCRIAMQSLVPSDIKQCFSNSR